MLDSRERRALKRRARELKSRMTVGKAGPTEPVIAEIQQLFEGMDLVKVRIRHDDRGAVEAIARDIAQAVPCELVGRTGFVVTLYRATSEEAGVRGGGRSPTL